MATARLFISSPLVFPLSIAPVTESGDTMLGLAVRKKKLDFIKYLVTECSVSVDGEQSVYISPAVCCVRGVCTHTYTLHLHCIVQALNRSH